MRQIRKYTQLFLIVFVFSMNETAGQHSAKDCESIFKRAQDLFSNDRYDEALKKLAAYKICAPQNSGKADTLIVKIYETVNKQKEDAISAKKEAIARKNEAEEQRRIVQNQLALTYWTNGQEAFQRKDYLVGLHYLAEAIVTTQDEYIKKSMLLDVETYLPVTFLKQILPDVDGQNMNSGVFSPDGKYVLTSAWEEAFLWDLNTGKKVFPDLKHNAHVSKAVFSPDGKQILTTAYLRYDPEFEGAYSASARVWDAHTGLQIGKSMKHKTQIETAFFDAAGKKILTLGRDSLVHLWDAASGDPIGSPIRFEGFYKSIAFTSDGKKIIALGRDSMLRCQDIISGNLVFPPVRIMDKASRITISHNGNYLLINPLDDAVMLYDAASGQKIRSMKHGPFIWNAVFSKDDNRIMTSGNDEVKLWNTGTGEQEGLTIKESDEDLFNFHPVLSTDGKMILSAGRDSIAQLWNVSKKEEMISTMKDQSLHVLDLSPDGSYALTAGGPSARVWKIAMKESNGFTIKNESPVEKAIFSRDKKLILTITRDTVVRIWNAVTGKLIGNSIKHDGKIIAADFSPDGKYFLTAVDDGTARIWESLSGLPVGDTIKHEDEINAAVFSPDGKYIVTASRDNTARIWEIPTAKLHAVMAHEGYVSSVTFSPNGKYILTGCVGKLTRRMKGSIRVWHADNGKPAGPPINYEDGEIKKAVFSPDGKLVLAIIDGSNYHAAVWNKLGTKKNYIEVMPDRGVSDAIFSPDGKLVLTTSGDNICRLWETATGKLFGLAIKHGGYNTDALFSPDGEYILTTGSDGTARLWQKGTGKQIGPPILHNRSVTNAVFSVDGKQVLTAGFDSTCRIWDIEGDLDIPADLFKLQIQVMTGCTFNLQTREIEFIPSQEWMDINWNKLIEDYKIKAMQHYKTCKYSQYNLWRRFFPEEAMKIRLK